MTTNELENIFTYHAPHGDQADRYERLRAAGKALAETIVVLCPNSRERSLAITAVQQAIIWANAAIAINEVFTAPQESHSEVFSRPECPFNYCDQPAPHTACQE